MARLEPNGVYSKTRSDVGVLKNKPSRAAEAVIVPEPPCLRFLVRIYPSSSLVIPKSPLWLTAVVSFSAWSSDQAPFISWMS